MVIINKEVPSALDGVESSISRQQASSSVHHVEHIDKGYLPRSETIPHASNSCYDYKIQLLLDLGFQMHV